MDELEKLFESEKHLNRKIMASDKQAKTNPNCAVSEPSPLLEQGD